jgi:hypothetical protein
VPAAADHHPGDDGPDDHGPDAIDHRADTDRVNDADDRDHPVDDRDDTVDHRADPDLLRARASTAAAMP